MYDTTRTKGDAAGSSIAMEDSEEVWPPMAAMDIDAAVPIVRADAADTASGRRSSVRAEEANAASMEGK